MKRIRALAALLLLVPAALVATTPSSNAQNGPLAVEVSLRLLEADSELNGGRLPPEEGTARFRVTTVVNVPPLTVCIVPITVVWKMTVKPAYATTVLNPAMASRTFYGATEPPTTGLAQDNVVFETFLTVTTTRAAPALLDGHYQVQADASAASLGQGICNLSPGTGRGDALLKNDYAPGFNVLEVDGQGSDTTIRLGNAANGDSKFTFEFGTDDGWTASGRTLRLESPAIHGEDAFDEGTVAFRNSELPSGWNHQIRITQSSAVAITTGISKTEVQVVAA